MQLSVIIPCYNEEDVLNETYRRLKEVVGKSGLDYELLFINDGSRDKTLQILYTLAQEDTHVKAINFSRNFGHQCAVSAGLRYCSGDLAVVMDADLQDPPEVISNMLAIQQREQANVVYAVRKHRDGESRFKLLTAKLFYRILNKMADVSFPVDTGDFRMVDRKVIDEFNRLHEKNKYIRGLVSWVGFKQVPCYYDRKERYAGNSKYSIRKMCRFALSGLVGFSRKPLKIATWTGTISVLISILWTIGLAICKIAHPDEKLILSVIAMLIVLFGGLMLCAIGILGEYISQIVDEAKDRPEYIISDTINFQDK